MKKTNVKVYSDFYELESDIKEGKINDVNLTKLVVYYTD
uniref:Uncharacterized protein n=1 Tax=viral metagenome TaxID=1070528 RepID=A0A6C0EMJ1_9ZZZZ